MSSTDDFNELLTLSDRRILYNRNDSVLGECLSQYREYSPGETALFGQLVRPGMAIIEAGANIGYHTVELAKRAYGGVVHAFEPQRLPFQTLCANVALNSLLNVFTYQEALGDGSEEVVIPDLDPRAVQNFGGLSLHSGLSGKSRETWTIDGLGLPVCHLIKADVEGMEWAVLAGAEQTIDRWRPILYVENDRRDLSHELISLIQKYRYRLYWHKPALTSLPGQKWSETFSLNMLCLPAEAATTLTHFKEITSPDQWVDD